MEGEMSVVKYMKNSGSTISFSLINVNNRSFSSDYFNLLLEGVERECRMNIELHRFSNVNWRVTIALILTVPPHLKQKELQLSFNFSFSKLKYLINVRLIDESRFQSDNIIFYDADSRILQSYNVDIVIYLPQDNEVNKLSLASDMNQLFLKKIHSDLVLIADGKVFNVHKSILAIRSKVFHKMLEADMQENKTGEVKLLQWNHTVVEQLLKYIYCDLCDMELNPHQLFRLAHYLEIRLLQTMCEDYLKANINMRYICDTLDLVNCSQYGLTELKAAAEEFVNLNNTKLARHSGFIEHLSKSIHSDNIVMILKFAHKHKIKNLLDKALDFVSSNNEVLETDDCEKLLTSEPSLMYRLLKITIKKS